MRGLYFPYVSERESNKKVANGLVALSAAAVLAVYSAGYVRTRSAADSIRAPGGRPEAGRARAGDAVRFGNAEGSPRPNPALVVTPSAAASPAPAPVAKRAVVRKPARAKPAPVETKSTPSVESAPAPVAEPPAPVPEQAPAAPATPPPAPAAPLYKDGTYRGWGTSRHGDIQAAVVDQDGRIVSAMISQCLTRYSCSVDREASAAGRRAAEPRSGLRLRRDAEHQRLLLRRRRGALESEVSDVPRPPVALMGTVVTIHVVGASDGRAPTATPRSARVRWFRRGRGLLHPVRSRRASCAALRARSACRFPRARSLLRRFVSPWPSPRRRDGAFDPTVGRAMEARGFDRDYRDRRIVQHRSTRRTT